MYQEGSERFGQDDAQLTRGERGLCLLPADWCTKTFSTWYGSVLEQLSETLYKVPTFTIKLAACFSTTLVNDTQHTHCTKEEDHRCIYIYVYYSSYSWTLPSDRPHISLVFCPPGLSVDTEAAFSNSVCICLWPTFFVFLCDKTKYTPNT